MTKGQLAHFYVDCAEAVLNHLRERPTVLKRYAGGIEAEPFYQKRVPAKRPDWLQTTVVTMPSGNTAEEFVPVDAAHLVWAVSLGNVDFNPHPVRRADLDHPDELRVDVDPTPGATWDTVRRVSLLVRDVLEENGLRGYPGTSGSRGMHIPIRIHPEWDFVAVRRAAVALAREVERRGEGLATAKWWKEERPDGSVFVDYNQNAKDHTVSSIYSVRPVADARVGCALAWDEVPDCDPADFRIDTVPAAPGHRRRPVLGHRRPPGLARRPPRPRRHDEHDRGLPDAPWPIHFVKQPGEEKRVQPSRARKDPKGPDALEVRSCVPSRGR